MPEKSQDQGLGRTLFEVTIEDTSGSGNEGLLTVSEPAEKVYLLRFGHGADNRLTSGFCRAFILGLDILQTRYPPGCLVTTSSNPKFYSNGLDLDHTNSTPHFFRDALYRLWRRLISYPMPTVALLNGHAFAGGLMLAMFHDYRAMNPHKGYVCLNEVELGVELRPGMSSVFREKVGAGTYRRMVLEGSRFKALDALNEGIVDWLGGLEETLTNIDEFKLVKKAQPGVTGKAAFAQLKEEMWRETISYLDDTSEESIREDRRALRVEKERAQREKKIAEWEGKEKATL